MTTVKIFSSKACAAPIQAACEVFERETGIKVERSMCGRHCQEGEAGQAGDLKGHHFLEEIAEAGIHDIAVGGAEYLLDDGEAAGIVQRGKRLVLAMRKSALIVPADNPAGIRGLDDLKRPGVRVGISIVDCLRGVWEDVCGRAGILGDVVKNIALRANGCMAIIEATAQKKVDAAFGWSGFEHLAPGRIKTIAVPDRFCVYRGTGAGLLSFSREPAAAERLMAFLASERARPFFTELGWVVRP